MKDKTIAILPFVNMSSVDDNEYFSDGITEEIINALAKIDGLRVTSRTSAFYFKGKNVPIREIGKQLKRASKIKGAFITSLAVSPFWLCLARRDSCPFCELILGKTRASQLLTHHPVAGLGRA